MVKKNPNGYKHVWVVYDTDDFPPEHIDQAAQLCQVFSTEETTYHAIWSNQSIGYQYQFDRQGLHFTKRKGAEIMTERIWFTVCFVTVLIIITAADAIVRCGAK